MGVERKRPVEAGWGDGATQRAWPPREMSDAGGPRGFSRQTLVSACEALETHTQASFSQVVIRLELEREISDDTGISVRKKCGRLARIVLQKAGGVIETGGGEMSLGEAVVREAVATWRHGSGWEPHQRLEQVLARDGYGLRWDEAANAPMLVPAMPVDVRDEKPDDEVHELLRLLEFGRSAGHLNQALEAHGRGHWAAANSQFRAFLESVVEAVARSVGVAGAERLTPANRLAALGKAGFLSTKRAEWTTDGKNYLNGLFKLLHSEGSHAGLSDAEHSTFRMHVVLVTARLLLRRLEQGEWRTWEGRVDRGD